MPILESRQPQIGLAAVLDLVGTGLDTASVTGAWKSLSVSLRTDSVAADKFTDATLLTEANFSGYAAIQPSSAIPQTVVDSGDNQMLFLLYGLEWAYDGTVTPTVNQNVTGYYVKYGGSSTLVCSELFDNPVSFNNDGDYLILNIAVPWPLNDEVIP